jgi:transposase InsO family protein
LFNWQKALKSEAGIHALSGKSIGRPKGNGALEQPYVRDFVLAHLYKYPDDGPRAIHKALSDRVCKENLAVRVPGIRRMQQWCKEWRESNKELCTFISNKDKWKNAFRIAMGDAACLVDGLNQEWEMDSTPSDLILSDGKRHCIVACIDVYSRRVKFHVSRTSTAHAVAACLQKAIIAWGVPDLVRTDNGRDYTSKHIANVLYDLHIVHDVCNPFSPEEKPFVERVFRTLLHDNFTKLIGYTGHNVAQREAIRTREGFASLLMKKDETVNMNLSPEELQAYCDHWSETTYLHRTHDRLGCSPYEKARQYAGPVKSIEDTEALRLLCLPRVDGDGPRVVRKKGVSWNNEIYIAPECGLYVGRNVQVRYEDADRPAQIYAYSPEGDQFLFTAKSPRLSGMTAEEVRNIALAGKRKQKRQLAESVAELKQAAKAAKLDQIVYESMDMDKQRAEKIEKDQPLRVQVLGNVHTTPALQSAAEAAAKPNYEPKAFTEEQQALHTAIVADFDRARQGIPAAPVPETADQRYARALSLERLEREGTTLSEKEKRWLTNYQNLPEYMARKDIFGDCVNQ